MQNKDFKKGLKSNNATLKSNKRDPSINDIPEIRFDPHLGRSNLYEIQEVLNTYVKLNLPSLKDCIATRKLKYVERPVLPTDSKIDSTNNINTTNNINVGNNDTTNVTNTNIIDANNTSNSQQQIAEDSLANENISEIDDENYGAKESYDPDDENDSEDEDEMAHFPQQIDDLLNTSIPYEIRLRMYERRMGEYERNKHEQDNHLSALHTIIHDLIPTDLLAKIKLNKEYKLALKKLDGFILWNVVFDEFQFKENQLSMVQQRIIAGRNFTNFRQNRIDLHTYYKIFKQNLKTMKQVGCHLPSTEEVIQYFIDGLDDNKFNNFKAFVRNSKHTNTTLPDNLEGIYYFALDFSSNNRTNNYNDSNQNSYNSNVYNTNIKQFKKNNKIKSNYNNIKNNNNSGDNDVNNDRKHSGNDNQINNNSSTTNQSQVIKCTFCNKKGHLIDDCRWKKKLQKLNNTDSSNNNNSTKINQNSSNNNNNNNSNNKNSSSQFYFEANEINIDEQNSDMVVFSSQKHDDIDDNLIVLDTGAQTSIFNNESMLHDINVSNIYLKIHGINKNSKPIQTNKFGYLKGLEDVKIYISHEIKRNILSYSQINNYYNIKWNSKNNSFTINGNNVNYNFKMENKLYIQQIDTDSNVLVTTVKQNLLKFTNSEIKQAELVKNIQQKLSYEPDASLIQAIKKGVIINLPITTRDVVNKNKIFGIDIERLKGGTVKRKSNVYKDIEVEKEEEKQQQLLIDLMYINKDTYFISLSDPMDLVMIKFINFGDIPNSKSKETLNETIIEHITSYKSQGFYINTVKSDNEPAMKALTTTINSFGAVHNTGGVGSNGLAKLDRKIRMIKERVRGLLSGLPYSWPSVILKWPVEYAVRTINMLPHSFQPFESRSPFEKYTGRKVDYKRDLRIGFGQYAQIHHTSTNNSMLERTSGGICLKPTSNANGSVYFLQLSTGRPVLVDHWTEIPTPDTVIKYMNDQAAEIKNKIITKDPTFKYHGKIIESEEGEEDKNLIKIPTKHDEYRMVMNLPPPNYVNGSENIKYDLNNYGRVVIKNKNFIDSEDDDESIDNIADGNCEEIITSDNLTPHETQLTDQIINNNQLSTTTLSVDPLSNNNIINNNNNDNTENNSHDENNNNININDDEIIINNNNNINDINNNNNNNNNRTESIQTRSGRKIIKNKKYFNTDINFITIEGDGDKELIELSIIEELKQMEEKQVFIPVNPNKINSTPIPCHMFVKSKVDSDGNFIKWKARIVAGGNKQNKHEILDVSSPTINRQKLMLICSIAAQQSKEVATIDIKGAFLNANMNDIVFMKLDRQLTNLMISINPEYRKYVNENNQLIVQLRKALYGCVQSSRLWYLELSNFIMSLGFNKSIHDDCVFFKIEDDGTYTHMCVYVDDILITSSNIKYIKYIEQSLKLKFSEISFNYGKLHQYLGMQLDFTNNGELIITMKNKINQLLEEYNIKNTATTPSTNNLFKNNQDKELLDKQDQDIIRSGVAKLLYISINMRYDISLPVNYLCSRVEKYNEDDIYKFIRILEYLNNTKDLYLKLKIGNINSLNVYIDASYAIREVDRRSQTGMVIKLGSATIMVRSSSQKIVTKSSTESELVAVADCISFIVDINNFLKEIGFEVTNNVIFQDNISTINLINNKKPTSQRTLHIDAKYFFIRERKLINNLIIRHLHTDKMIADMLTKPIQGKKFNNLKNQIMNIN